MNEHSTQLEKWHALAAHAEGCLRVRVPWRAQQCKEKPNLYIGLLWFEHN
jgi:hypothetical protein